eukprot:CAMPEP_0119064408 /NCGR_PEP_ID=MMETSP1178-20130426/7501_1 /TAXON_ID=33656 /ORGANISM="unid sp, Strain CCMP2000" /LENGTH=71 /DNA_ID=CAMNT_0007045849 /DNA_START=163 /DNA_END=378 /DNA_ORIENTATION=+
MTESGASLGPFSVSSQPLALSSAGSSAGSPAAWAMASAHSFSTGSLTDSRSSSVPSLPNMTRCTSSGTPVR